MKHRSANMKQKPYGFYEAARCAVKRSAVLLLREPNSQSEFSALLHRAKPCFILHAPQVRFISKQKSTALAVLFCLEAPPGFEPGDKGFADLCLTTWLCRHIV